MNEEIPSFNLVLSPNDIPSPASPAEVLTDDLSEGRYQRAKNTVP